MSPVNTPRLKGKNSRDGFRSGKEKCLLDMFASCIGLRKHRLKFIKNKVWRQAINY